eukprot:SAG31_NODE_35110_length_326_cov_0.726872_1_plen_42_part_01
MQKLCAEHAVPLVMIALVSTFTLNCVGEPCRQAGAHQCYWTS